MNIPLDEVIYFDSITSTPSTGAAVDADSTPTFAVYEESTDTDIGVGGNLTKRTSLTGNYRGSFTLSAANGFEVGKWYSIIGSAVVGGVTGKAVLKNFRVVAAEAIAGKPKADIDGILGTAISTPATAGILDVNVKNIDNDAASASGTVTFPNATLASTTNITAATGIVLSGVTHTGAVIPTVSAVTGLTAADVGAIKAKTDNLPASPASTTNITAASGVSLAADQAVNAAKLGGVTVTATTSVTFPAACTVASTTGAVGSVTGNVGGNVTGSVGSVAAGGIAAASFAAGAIDANAVAADAGTEIADAILKRDWTSVTGEAARSVLNALRFLRNKWSVSAGTLTVTKEDDSTSAWTASVTSDAAADPITGSDPA